MPIVSVRINGKEYQLACDEGQQEQLVALSQEIDDRVCQLARQVPHATEPVLHVLVSIMLADELADAKRSLRDVTIKFNRLQESLAREQQQHDSARLREMEAALAAALDSVAGRIERLAAGLEKA